MFHALTKFVTSQQNDSFQRPSETQTRTSNETVTFSPYVPTDSHGTLEANNTWMQHISFSPRYTAIIPLIVSLPYFSLGLRRYLFSAMLIPSFTPRKLDLSTAGGPGAVVYRAASSYRVFFAVFSPLAFFLPFPCCDSLRRGDRCKPKTTTRELRAQQRRRRVLTHR